MERKYPESAVRRAMKSQEVILKAVAGQIKWIQAADILGVSPRTMLRKYKSYQEHGIAGLIDQRTCRPSRRRVPYDDVEKVLKLYREKYFDYNVKHFHEKLLQDHGIMYSYTWVKNLLQQTGLVKKGKGKGGHRKRRDRRILFGQMVHLDGSLHPWLSLRPDEKQVLLLAVDDATGWNLAGRLVEAETTRDCMAFMWEVVQKYGIPAQLYTDRGSVFWHTKTAGGKVDQHHLTQFGRAMDQLGVEMIPGYSPQARGRGERWNGTWQGRLVAELRNQGIDDIVSANQYIQDVFIPDMNRRFTVNAAEEGSAFVSAQGADLNRIFAIIHNNRKVAADNTVRVNRLVLQIEKSPYRISFARCNVDVYEHLDGTYTVIWKKRVIGRYDQKGNSLNLNGGPAPQTPRGLTLFGIPDEQKMKRQDEKSSCPSVYPPAAALGSLPSVALSSEQEAQP